MGEPVISLRGECAGLGPYVRDLGEFYWTLDNDPGAERASTHVPSLPAGA
jgi:hypothetical protein